MIVYAICNPNEWAGQFQLRDQLREAGQEDEIVRLGLDQIEPLPDWITYHNAAESMSCPPWDLFEVDETPPPKRWWRETRMMLDAARATAREQQAATKGA